MRIFIALDIDSEIRQRIWRFVEGVRNFSPDAKWVGPETFHITLKFIGEKPPDEVERVREILRNIKATPFKVSFSGYGFFPNPRSARVFWVGIHADDRLPQLSASIDEATAALGIPREEHGFKPHLTLARARGASGAPHRRAKGDAGSPFTRVHEKLQGLSEPEFGTMTATEFFLYESKLSPKGAQYTKLERFAIRSDMGEPAHNE